MDSRRIQRMVWQVGATAALAAWGMSAAAAAVQAEGTVADGAAAVLARTPASPLLSIDRHRVTVVDRVMTQWGDALAGANAGIDRAQLREILQSMRADQLLAASLAGSLEGLRNVVAASLVGEAREPSALLRAKSLGDASQDLTYVPVVPCRLLDTRPNYAAVYQGGGAFSANEVRPYTLQGGNGVCLTQLAPGASIAAVQLQVFGIPTAGGSGDIEILPQGATFGGTATLVFLGNNAFTSSATTSLANLANNQIAVQVRRASADVAIDVVGYFRAPTNIELPDSTSAGTGNIDKPGGSFLHNFGVESTFLGVRAGNFTAFGVNNTGVGSAALSATTTGAFNTAVGRRALAATTSGFGNAAFGANALASNTTGDENIAVGPYALFSNASGQRNLAAGSESMTANTSGSYNVGLGYRALQQNTTGGDNVAVGGDALNANVNGSYNTAVGTSALGSNASGLGNVAVGNSALFGNVSGDAQVAVGLNALLANTTGTANTAIGAEALHSNVTGQYNLAAGFFALYSNQGGQFNVAIGDSTLSTLRSGESNVALGSRSGSLLVSGSNNIYLGNLGQSSESDTIRVGDAGHLRAFVGGIRGTTTGLNNAIAVVIDSNGQLGTFSSSREGKTDIEDMDDASRALMRLRPVTFHYKDDRDPAGPRMQYGLIAEEVADVYPELVARNAQGRVETVMYHYLPPMMLNELQKQQKTIALQAQEIEALKQAVAALVARDASGPVAAKGGGEAR